MQSRTRHSGTPIGATAAIAAASPLKLANPSRGDNSSTTEKARNGGDFSRRQRSDHAAATGATEWRRWLSARKAEKRREDFCSALGELGEQLDDIRAYAENYLEDDAPFDVTTKQGRDRLRSLIEQSCAIADGELAQLWCLVDEEGAR